MSLLQQLQLPLLFLWLLLGLCWCQTDPPTDNTQVVSVRSSTTSGDETPDTIQVTFVLNNDKISLFLQRNPNVRPNAAVVLGQNGRLVKYVAESSQKCAYYTDLSAEASLLVKVETNSDGSISYSYTGVFQVRGKTFSIEPETKSRRRRKRRRRRRRRRSEGGAKRLLRRGADSPSSELHVIQRQDTSSIVNAGSPLTIPNGTKIPPFYEKQDPPPGSEGNTVLDPTPKTTYVVKLLAVVDYRTYRQMYDLSTESTEEARVNDTIQRITQYYGHVINGVDMRYQSINVSTMAINVRFAGCYIALDPNSSPFIENNRVTTESSTFVPAVRALSDFADWDNEHAPDLPAHNQASLYALDPLNGATGDRISGLAYYKSMCSYWAVLICRHSSIYALSEVTAHELGHNFGAGHDGIDNACSAALQHIMVASSAPLTDATYKNAYTFSSCSISEIAGWIQTLPPNNCLTEQSDSSPAPEPLTPLGAVYSPDAQCSIIYGNGSFYCSGLNEDRQICRTMGCYHPVWQYCVTTYDQRALTGTQCGNKMWCYMGDCVSNEKAPEIPSGSSADCLYGDSRVPYYDGFQCSNVSSQPQKCYVQSVANSCCKSCRDVRNEDFPGCEYGDRNAGCADFYQPQECVNSNVREACCEFCSDRKSAPTSSTTTPTTVSTSTTTTTTKTVPTTTRLTTTPQTPCIDVYGVWCRSPLNFPPSFCYTSNQYYCCAFCASIRDESRPDCEYGDRYTWCDASRCVNPNERQSCCGSCASFLLSSSSTSTTTTPTTTTSTTTRTTTRTTTSTTTPTTTPTTTTTTTPTTTTTTTSTTSTTKPTTTTTSTTTPTTTTTKSTTTSATTSSSTTRTTTTTTSTSTLTTTTAPTGRTTRVSSPGTVCIDSKTICASIDQSQCYSSTIRNMCCLTCRNFGTGLPGCEYGDQYPILCTTVSSYNCPYYRVECCRTCGIF